MRDSGCDPAAGYPAAGAPAGSRFNRLSSGDLTVHLSGGDFNIYLSGEDLPNRLSGGESLWSPISGGFT